MKEGKQLKVDAKDELNVNFVKDIFCTLFSSDNIEQAVWACMDRAIYKGLKIDKDTFNSAENRVDYMAICKEVAMFNIAPFTKSLYAEFEPLLKMVEGFSQE